MFLELLQHFFMFSHISGNGSFPKPLTAEEEKHYIDLYENGTTENKHMAKNILIEHNLRLVAHIVKKYNLKDNEDLISIGTIGLIKGINSYKSEKGVKLATYTSRCIENEILMSLRSAKKYSSESSLQDPIGTDKEGNQVTLEDKLPDGSESIEDQIHREMQYKLLYETVVQTLKDRERKIIEMRYGIYSGKERTQREIAKILDISRSYVSRIEKKALKKLERELRKVDGGL